MTKISSTSQATGPVFFRKVLVANRGEIARRIARTLREMGLASVAVFTDADQDAPHVIEADEAVRIPSYLEAGALIAAAQAVDAEAIHPGYGFLAENADFARRCSEAGIVFIGPSSSAIEQMGNKARAKALAAELGVPSLEGFPVADRHSEVVREKASELGYPLLIKAVAGGGGKGMRTVEQPNDLTDALEASAREAEGAFGDPSLMLERFVPAPRHVEVQILSDHHGRAIHLFERECSIQRRHQKVFEESPSPAVDDGLRARLGAAAVSLAQAVEYRGAGTVEFLLDAEGEFYFLEMNTRLQVEHPVTEAITGLDLVRLQVEIAQGLPLEFEQDELEISGHAIEARLYAEDPQQDFLPAAGTVVLWAVPDLPGLRVDSGVERGSVIGVDYDPMLAKVIAHGRTRREAAQRLRHGLAELAVGGLVTNRDFLLAVLDHAAFLQGDLDTRFIERHFSARHGPSRTFGAAADSSKEHALAATLHGVLERRREPSPVPVGVPTGWRASLWRPQEQSWDLPSGSRLTVRYVARGSDRFDMSVQTEDSESSEPAVHRVRAVAEDERLVLEIDGIRRPFRVATHPSKPIRVVHGRGRVVELVAVPRFPERRASSVAGGCAAPMTGKVIDVRVSEGDTVRAGDPLVVLEAMKMEHQLRAQEDGVVQAVRVEAGQMVEPDEVLVVVEPGGST